MADRSQNIDQIMENPTTFDLNRSIREWRETLEPSGAARANDLDELEHHLRDSIERLRAKDLSEEEAFFVAARRVGSPEILTREFAKVNSGRVWQARLCWMLAGLLILQLFQISSVAFAMTASMANLRINGHVLGALLVLLKWALLVIPIVFVLWFPIARRESASRVAARWLSHPIITSICLVAIPTILVLLFATPFPIGGHWQSAMTNEAMTRLRTATTWASYGFYLAHGLVIPVALVYFARRTLRFSSRAAA